MISLDSLRRRKEQAFAWMNATQFSGALNDNIFKALVQMFLIGMVPSEKSHIMAVATLLFSLPYLFLVSYAGFLADRFSKKTITVALKYAELTIMILAVAGFMLGSRLYLFAMLFLMSAQSALFSPAKYGIMPEIVHRDKLSKANGYLVMCSFIAIIIGSMVAPALAAWCERLMGYPHDALAGKVYALAQVLCIAVAIFGVFTSHRVFPVRAANAETRPDLLFMRRLWRTSKWVRQDGFISTAMLATAIFSMLAAYMQINLVCYGMDCLGLDEKRATFLFFYPAIGIATGAVIAGRLSNRNIEFGTMPLGSGLIFLSVFLLGVLPANMPMALIIPVIFLAGAGAGLFVVPLDTFIQMRLPKDRRGAGLALNTFLSWLGIFCAALAMMLFGAAGINPKSGFLIFSFVALLLALGSLFFLKDFAFRFFVTTIVRLLYKVRVCGIENVPIDGPALLVCNHASYMDALLLCATSRRRIRFIMSRKIFETWRILRPVFKLYNAIPIGDYSSPRQTVEALRAARKALDDGFLVCIFAEGGITRTGNIQAFKRGYERIVRGSTHPIIPVYLGGSWGTIYHYYQGQLVRRWFRMSLHRYRVMVVFGKPLPPTTTPFKLRQTVMELSCVFFNLRKDEHRSMATALVRESRRSWGNDFASDTLGMSVTWGKALVASTALALHLKRRVRDQRHVGILLPACVAGTIANEAVALLERVAVNLNFTIGKAAFESSMRQCEIRTIITSRAFLERFPNLPIPAGSVVFIEDILRNLTLRDKLVAFARARFAPASNVVCRAGSDPDAPAMVLFSSGSTGDPKGVMITHHNVLSMLESFRMIFANRPNDHMCSGLPLFHSFGIICCVWYPLLTHMKITMHANPLDAATIVEIVKEHRSTLLIGTPTFLSVYMRKATKEDFKSLRFVLAGGEKLKESLIRAYIDKYGFRPYEAYGATELSPGISVSVPDGTGGGITQEGWRANRVGMPVPGIVTKVLDPDTGEELGPGQPGLLYLKGPNVMLGYLGRDDLTAQVISDGWYCTGDIAFVDEDGFIGLTDRLSRFSKVGGEMVPHVAVEEALLSALGLSGAVLAVTGVPDERKGERLAVLYTPECGDPEWLRNALDQSELPNIWKPARDAYYPVESIPVLGTGKTDLAAVKKLARELSERPAEPVAGAN